MIGSFYLAMAINDGSPGSRDGSGIDVARRVAQSLERVTGAVCISRWLGHPRLNDDAYLKTLALADAMDLAVADFVIVVPLTGSARGVHVEMGMGLMAGKPVYLYAPPGRDPVAFDELCLRLPLMWAEAIEDVLSDESR